MLLIPFVVIIALISMVGILLYENPWVMLPLSLAVAVMYINLRYEKFNNVCNEDIHMPNMFYVLVEFLRAKKKNVCPFVKIAE